MLNHVWIFRCFSFYKMNTARKSQKVLIDIQQHVCTTRGKRFTFNDSLIVHRRIHYAEKPFNCNVCDMSFNQNCDFKIYQITHFGLEIYQCDVCKTCFPFTFALNVNYFIKTCSNATSEKRFGCELCENDLLRKIT